MTDGTGSQGLASVGSSVERAVARERRRMKAVLIAFACLLAIPIASGVLVFRVGRTDADKISYQVKAQMANRMEERVAPVEATVRETRSALATVQKASQDIGAQRAQVEALKQEQVVLRRQIEGIGLIEKSVPPDIQNELRDLRRMVESQRAAQEKLQVEHQRLREDLGRVSTPNRPEEIRKLREDLEQLRRQVNKPQPIKPRGPD